MNHGILSNVLFAFAFLSLWFFVSPKSHAQCSSISIDVDTNKSCAPGIFEFVVKGSPSGATFVWDFNKGGASPGTDTFRLIEPNPRKIPVTLYTYLTSGAVCTTKVNTIAEVFGRPIPSASINDRVFCNTSESYELIDKTVNSVFRIWTIEGTNYGDTAKSRTGKFTSDGDKTISLMVEDVNGCRGVKSFPDWATVLSNKKIEIVGVRNIGCVNTDMSFSFNSDFKPSELSTVNWKFDHGFPATSTDLKPSNIKYSNGGKYDVSLTLESKNGCTYTSKSVGLAQPKDSVVLDVFVGDSAICATKNVKIVVRNNGLYGPLTFDVPSIKPEQFDSLSPLVRTINFTDAGNYDLSITYQDSFCTSRYVEKDFIVAKRVTAQISSNQYYDCEVPFLAKLKDNSYTSEVGNVTYRWLVFDTLGNLITGSTKKDFDFVVKDSGYYDVELTVTHENGCSDSVLRTKFIRADSIRIDYDPISEVVCLNQEVQIFNFSFSSSYKESDYFVWKLYKHGDTSKAIDSSYKRDPTFIAKYKGSYDLKVFASNALGCTQTDFRENAFEVNEPKAGFRVERTTHCPSDTFSLISSNSPEKGEYISRWVIYNDKDTVFAGGKRPIVEVDSPGEYSVNYSISVFGFCRDTAIKSNIISITGIQSQIKTESKRACKNLPYSPEASYRNYVSASDDTTVYFSWTVSPKEATIIDEASNRPKIYFSKDGFYRIQLICTNAFGCADTSIMDSVQVGLQPEIDFLDTAVCAGTGLRFIQATDSFTNRFYYRLSPTENFTVKTSVSDTQSIVVNKQGVYDFSIIASRDSICFDTTSTKIYIVSPIADFEALDSNLYCAPVYQRFVSTSQFADTLFWDFGDGKKLKTDLSKVTTLYEQNTGNLNPYTVRLIAKNRSGCSDTLVKNKLVKVDGPSIQLELLPNRGCEPLEVMFTGATENVHKMYIDYGDGGEFGYSLGQSHTYFNKWRIVETTYDPVVLVVDKNGCQTAVKSDSTIYVKPSPTAEAVVDDTIACYDLTTRYYYIGKDATKWYWDFDGNGTLDDSSSIGLHSYKTPGRYGLTLISENSFDCHDTFVTPVHVVKGPEIKIVKNDVLCINSIIEIADGTLLDTTFNSRKWTITSGLDEWFSTDSNFTYPSTKSGILNIKLEVSDIIGCVGSDSTTVTIKDSANSNPAEIKVVTVSEEGFGDITASKSGLGYQFTQIEKKNDFGGFDNWSLKSVNQTGNVDSFSATSTKPQCYKIQHIDSCGFKSKKSPEHCTIYLKVVSVESGKNDLNWTKYIGWNVDKYQIIRTVEGVTSMLAEVNGNVLNYSDTLLCDKNYCYKIVGINESLNVSSQSNSVCSRPVYNGNTTFSNIQVVSVVDNSYIQVTAEGSVGDFIITKEINPTNQVKLTNNQKEYYDYNVDVSSYSYEYSIKQIDYCGDTSQSGQIGKSILFDLEKEGLDLTMHWTAYKSWKNGVKEYIVYRNKGGSFVEFKSITGSDTAVHIKASGEVGSSNCFKVVAVSENGLRSESNIRCITGEPVVFIPNAFSPDDDDLNEGLKPYSLFIKSPKVYEDGLYIFSVYNRWGELLFSTNDPELGWDGTYMNNELPQGNYMYTLRLKGLDNKIQNFSGLVTLVR